MIDWAAQVRLHGGDAARLPDGFADWYGAINVAEPTRGNNLRRFANYMEHGTLSRLRNEAGHLTAAPEEVDHDPDVESENECYDRYDVTSYAELSVSELKERDEYVAQIRQARAMAISSGHRYGALLEDGAPADALEDARNQAQLDYDTLVDTVNEANDWIDGIRERIDWSIDEVSHMSASAHDSIVVDELQGWKDSLESIAFAPHVRFDEEFDRRRYDLEIDVSPLREMQTEI
ncbi:MAG TPA: hypothetical protein VME66_15260, partial [Candidatus Acidoferrales bacterium]|nr:hypothetical protein [Candidatus Acidoferrales bacterium]